MSLQCFGGRSVLFKRARVHRVTRVTRNPGWVIRSTVAVVACAAIIPGLVACRRDQPPSGLPESTTSGTPAPNYDDEVRAFMDLYWQEWRESASPPGMDRPLFSLLTARALDVEIEEMGRKIREGQARRFPDRSRFSHTIVKLTASSENAIVYECVVDDAILYRQADGHVIDDEIETDLIMSQLRTWDRKWQIEFRQTVDRRQGEQQCAAP